MLLRIWWCVLYVGHFWNGVYKQQFYSTSLRYSSKNSLITLAQQIYSSYNFHWIKQEPNFEKYIWETAQDVGQALQKSKRNSPSKRGASIGDDFRPPLNSGTEKDYTFQVIVRLAKTVFSQSSNLPQKIKTSNL